MDTKKAIGGLFFTVLFIIGVLVFAHAQRPLQSNISKGVYIHNEIVTKVNIRNLPIPLTYDNYAFYQSIGKTSLVVIGNFKTGDKVITLIKDTNVDGEVDLVCHWYVEEDKIDIERSPRTVYSAAQFKKLKEDIINGTKTKDVTPNAEALNYMTILAKRPSNVVKMRNGYRITGMDPDYKSLERVSYYFSDNTIHGVDIAFETKYNNLGNVRIKPLIPISVYCKNSFDPFAKATVKKLMGIIK